MGPTVPVRHSVTRSLHVHASLDAAPAAPPRRLINARASVAEFLIFSFLPKIREKITNCKYAVFGWWIVCANGSVGLVPQEGTERGKESSG